MKRLLTALFIMIGAAALSVEANAQGHSVSVKIGHEKPAARGDLRIKFLEMIEDSRCPRDVECIQAGNASVRVRVSRNGRSKVMVLNTNLPNAAPNFAGYRFSLTALTPEPASNIRINPNGYVATIAVKKA